jgi:hypothetical protein
MAMAARAIDVNRSTIFRRMRDDEKFMEQVHAARKFADEVVEKSLFNQARKGHVVACIFWLKNRQPEKWMDTYQKKQSGEITIKIVRGADEKEVQLPSTLIAKEAVAALKN